MDNLLKDKTEAHIQADAELYTIGYNAGWKSSESQLIEHVTRLHLEACDNYNNSLPKTKETNDDSWYYEGKRNAYNEILELLKSTL